MKTDRQLIRIGDEDILFDPGKILLSEALAIEDKFDLTWPQVVVGVNVARMKAVAAVVWVMRKRISPTLQPSDVEFNIGDLEILDPDKMPEYGGTPDEVDEGEAPKDSTEPAEESTEPQD